MSDEEWFDKLEKRIDDLIEINGKSIDANSDKIEALEKVLQKLIQYLWREHDLLTTKYSNELLEKIKK